MDVIEWMSYECSDEGTCTQNICTTSTRSHPSEEEDCPINRSKNYKCEQALTRSPLFLDVQLLFLACTMSCLQSQQSYSRTIDLAMVTRSLGKEVSFYRKYFYEGTTSEF
jgi:hypothetical protein